MTAIISPRSSVDYTMAHDVLDHAPNVRAVTRSMWEWHKMNALDQEDFKQMQATVQEGRDLKWVSRTPLAVMATLLQRRPNIMQDPKAFYSWLQENKVYQVPKSR